MSEPLSGIKRGKTVYVQSIDGNDGCRRHLEEMGFLPGTPVEVCRVCGGPLIVTVRGSKLILGQQLARKIIVDQTYSLKNQGGMPLYEDVERRAARPVSCCGKGHGRRHCPVAADGNGSVERSQGKDN